MLPRLFAARLMLLKRFKFRSFRLARSAVSMLIEMTLRGVFISWVESFMK